MKNYFLLALAVVGLIALAFAFRPPQVGSTMTGGLQSTVNSSATIVVGPDNVVTLFSAYDACAARIISTVSQPVLLSFSSSVTPNGTTGHVQAASTTSVYDNGEYGCGAITAYGYASSTITKTQTVR